MKDNIRLIPIFCKLFCSLEYYIILYVYPSSERFLIANSITFFKVKLPFFIQIINEIDVTN